MTAECLVDQVSSAEWDALAPQFSDFSVYQTWGFGEISAADAHSQVSRMVVRRGDAMIGAAQLRIKRLPLLNAGLAYVYFGPLWRRDGAEVTDLRDVLDSLRWEYGDRRRLGVRIVPNLHTTIADPSLVKALLDAGFDSDSGEDPYRTMFVDLLPPLEVLRKQPAQKWRNGLNQGEKRGVRIEVSHDSTAMERFELLYDAMWSTKQFETGVCVSSFRRLQESLPPGQKLTIMLAFVGEELAAGHVSSTLGETCIYLLGASNDIGRENKASYVLQWRAVQAAKEAGARWYDLGGIDPERNPGVYHFKAGLGGVDITFLGQFTARGRGSARYLVPLAEKAYRALAPLRRHMRASS